MAEAKTMLTSSGSAPVLTGFVSPMTATTRTTRDMTDTDNSVTTTDGDMTAAKPASHRKLRGITSSFSKFNNNFSPARAKAATVATTSPRKSSPRMERANSMHFNFETVRPPRVKSPPTSPTRRLSSSVARSSTPSSLHPSLVALLTTKDATGTKRLNNNSNVSVTSADENEDKPPVVFRRQYDRLDWKRVAAIDVEQMYRTKNYDSLSDNLLQLTFCDVESEITDGDPRLLQLFKLAQLGLEFLLFNYDRASKALERAKKDRQNAEMKLMHQQADADERFAEANQTIASLRDEVRRRKKTIAAQQEVLNALSSSCNISSNYHSCAYCGKSFIDGAFLEKHINARHPELLEHYYASMQTTTSAVPVGSTYAAAYMRKVDAARHVTTISTADFQVNDFSQINTAHNRHTASPNRPPTTDMLASDVEGKLFPHKNPVADSLQVGARNANDNSLTIIPVTKTASQMAMQEMLRELRELKTKIASAEKEHQQERHDYQSQLESLSQRESNLRKVVDLYKAETDMLMSQQQHSDGTAHDAHFYGNAADRNAAGREFLLTPSSPLPQQQPGNTPLRPSTSTNNAVKNAPSVQPLDILPSSMPNAQKSQQNVGGKLSQSSSTITGDRRHKSKKQQPNQAEPTDDASRPLASNNSDAGERNREASTSAKEVELAQQIDQLKHLIDTQAQQQQVNAANQLQATERANQARYATLVESCAKHASVEDLRRFLHTELFKMNQQFEQRLERARSEYTHENADRTRDLLDELEHSKQRLFEATRAVADVVIANENNNKNGITPQQQVDSNPDRRIPPSDVNNQHRSEATATAPLKVEIIRGIDNSSHEASRSDNRTKSAPPSPSVIAAEELPKSKRLSIVMQRSATPPDIVTARNDNTIGSTGTQQPTAQTPRSQTNVPSASPPDQTAARSRNDSNHETAIRANNDEAVRQQQAVSSSTQQLAALINLLNIKSSAVAVNPRQTETVSANVVLQQPPQQHVRAVKSKKQLPSEDSEISSSSEVPQQQSHAVGSSYAEVAAGGYRRSVSADLAPHPSPSTREMLKRARGEMLEHMTAEQQHRHTSQQKLVKADESQTYESSGRPVNDRARGSAAVINSSLSRNNPVQNRLAASGIDVSKLQADEVQLLQQVLLTNDDDDDEDEAADVQRQARQIGADEPERQNNRSSVTHTNRSDDTERQRSRLSNSSIPRVAENSVRAAPTKRTSLLQAAEIIASSLVGDRQQQASLKPEEREFLAQLLQESNSREKLAVAAADGPSTNRSRSSSRTRPTIEGALSPSNWRSRSASPSKIIATPAAVESLTKIADRIVLDDAERAIVNKLLSNEIDSDNMWRDSVDAPRSSPALRQRSSAAAAKTTTHVDRVIKADQQQAEEQLQRRLLQRQQQKSAHDMAVTAAQIVNHVTSDSASDARVTNRWSAHVSPRVSRALLQDATFLAQFRAQAERDFAKKLSEVGVPVEGTSSGNVTNSGGLTDQQMQDVMLAADEQRREMALKNQRFSNYRKLHEQSLSNLNAAIEAAQAEQDTENLQETTDADIAELEAQVTQEIAENAADGDEAEDESTETMTPVDARFLARGAVSTDSLMTASANDRQLPLTNSGNDVVGTNTENMGEMWQTNRELDAVRNSFELLNPQKRVSFSSRVSRFTPDAELPVADAAASASSFTTHVRLRQQQQQQQQQLHPSATANGGGGGGGGVETSTSFDDGLVAADGYITDNNNTLNARIVTAHVSANDIDKISAEDSFISMLDPVVDKCIQVPSTRDFATSDSNIAVPIQVSSLWMNSEPDEMVSSSTLGSGGNLDEQSGYVEQFDDADNSDVFHVHPPKQQQQHQRPLGSDEQSARTSVRSGGLMLNNNKADLAQFRSSTMLLQQLPSKRDVSVRSRTQITKKDTGTSSRPASRFNSRAALTDVVRQDAVVTARKQLQQAIVAENDENDDDDDDEAVDVDEAARILLGQTTPGVIDQSSSDDDVPDPDLQTLPVLTRSSGKNTTGRNPAANSLLPSTVSAAESIVYSLSERSSFRPPTGVASTAMGVDVQLSSPSSIDLAALTNTLTAMPDTMSNEQRALNLKVQSIMMNASSSHLVSAPQPHATGAVIAPMNSAHSNHNMKLSVKDLELIAALRDASPSPSPSAEDVNASGRTQQQPKFQLTHSSTANVSSDLAHDPSTTPFVQRGYVRAGDTGKNNPQQQNIDGDDISDDVPPTHEKVIIVGGGKKASDTGVAQIPSNAVGSGLPQHISAREKARNVRPLSGNVNTTEQSRRDTSSPVGPAPTPAKRRTRTSVDLTPKLQSSLISLDDIEKEMQDLNALPTSARKQPANKRPNSNTTARPNSAAASAVDDSDDD